MNNNNQYLLIVDNYQIHDRFDQEIDQVHRKILLLLMYYVALPLIKKEKEKNNDQLNTNNYVLQHRVNQMQEFFVYLLYNINLGIFFDVLIPTNIKKLNFIINLFFFSMNFFIFFSPNFFSFLH